MKNRLSIIVSLISLAGVLVIAGIWIFGSIKISVVSLDTFIGICVALMAIVFTVIVGLQIVNAIDMKERISETERKQKEQIEIERRLAENDLIQTTDNCRIAVCNQWGHDKDDNLQRLIDYARNKLSFKIDVIDES